MANPTSPSPGAGWTWVDGQVWGDDGQNSTPGQWIPPSDPNAAANYEAGAAAKNWTLPKAPGASYFAEGTGYPWVTPGLQRSMNEFFSTPTSGYGSFMAPGGADYGSQLGRWQFSTSAPVSKTAPQGWGRYPGVGGAPPQASWVQPPPTTSAPPSQGTTPRPPPKLGTNYSLPTAPAANPATLPQQPASTGTPSTSGWMPQPSATPPSASGFQFQNAAPNSVQANYNALLAKYGPQQALNYLMSQGSSGRNGTVSPLAQWQAGLQAQGMSSDDINRIINSYAPGGSGENYDNTFAQQMPGLLASVGATAPTFDKAAYRQQLAQMRANTPKPVWRG